MILLAAGLTICSAMHEQNDLHRFDPYHEWLGIPPAEQPPNHYRLLGLSLFESNPSVIVNAADRQMAHLKTFSIGPRSVLTQSIANQVSEAAGVLTTPDRKATYDAWLQRRGQLPVAPLAVAAPFVQPPQLPAFAVPPAPPPAPPPLPPQLPPQTYAMPLQAYQLPVPPAEPLQFRRRVFRRRKKSDPGAVVMEIAKIAGGGIAGIAAGFVIIYFLTGLSPEEFLTSVLKAVGG